MKGDSGEAGRTERMSPMLQDRLIDRSTRIWIALALLAFLIVDVQTRIYDYHRSDATPPLARILLQECSGVGAYLAMVWSIGWLAARVPPGYLLPCRTERRFQPVGTAAMVLSAIWQRDNPIVEATPARRIIDRRKRLQTRSTCGRIAHRGAHAR